jgi:hypothetical protein
MMVQARENPFGPASPHSSSGGADSFKGTPDTRLTAFSPADSSAKSARALQGACSSASTTPPVRAVGRGFLDPASQPDKDPFVSPGYGTGLSPTASSFQPFGQPGLVQPSHPGAIVASALSNNLGVFRLISVSGPVAVSPTQVESWLKVWYRSQWSFVERSSNLTMIRSSKTKVSNSMAESLLDRPRVLYTSNSLTSEMRVPSTPALVLPSRIGGLNSQTLKRFLRSAEPLTVPQQDK